jgi:23S rRNA (adenine1618-N6)-methyltransferase
MPLNSKPKPAEKANLHPRNLHRSAYDFALLTQAYPQLKAFIIRNPHQTETVDFTDPKAVIALNKALLKQFYGVNHWDIPAGYLCPPIPGRADYVHYLADVLAESNDGALPAGKQIKVLDIGTGANCVYPLIGASSYGWHFTGTDVDATAIQAAKKNASLNPSVSGLIDCRLQTNSAHIFKGVIKPTEFFDITMCNPPFHASLKEAQAGTVKKWKNLDRSRQAPALLNFGGQKGELWYNGGEAGFISRMIEESAFIPHQCYWFTTLVSKKENLEGIYRALRRAKAVEVKTIPMSQGQKVSRIVAWTFLTEAGQLAWKSKGWA